MGKQKKQKVILPPDLPPEIPDDEVEFSDEDVQFLSANPDYAHSVSRINTESIDKHLKQVAGVEEDALEAIYEERSRKKALKKVNEKPEVQVDPVDALPVKTLGGELYYRKLQKSMDLQEGEDDEDGEKGGDVNRIGVKLTKAERRAKLKKTKKDAKKQGKELPEPEGATTEAPQAAALAEVKEDLTAEEAFESKKCKLAELGMALLSDPESHIKQLGEMLQLCKDDNHFIVKLAFLSLLAVFKDIIPGYRIRLPTEKELEVKVSKDVKKMRMYESTLLSAYKSYLQKLMAVEKVPMYQHVVIRSICNLLDAAPHFNFRDSLIQVVVGNLSSSDDVVRKLCCDTIKSLFTNEGKHGGEATVEVVRLIASHVKINNCQMHPDSIEVFMSLSFDEDLGRQKVAENKNKSKNFKRKFRKAKIAEEKAANQPEDDRKNSKKQLKSKMREEVAADYKAAAFAADVSEKRRMQSETLAAVFETYFRILKHTMYSISTSVEENSGSNEGHLLLGPALNGLGKYSHLIDLDYIGDLMSYLKKLASGGGKSDGSSGTHLTISERLRCCIIAFKFMKNNLDALNVDLQEFFVQLYNLILEYRPGRDEGEVLAEALRAMLYEDRQHDMQKAAAFIKRLATFSLCFGTSEATAALLTIKHLLLKNVKCRVLLENDAGGGSFSGSVAKYHPYATDPNQSGALSSVLWELNLLSKHYHPTISSLALGISNLTDVQKQTALLGTLSPQQAFKDFSLEEETFSAIGGSYNIKLKNTKRKRAAEEDAKKSAVADTPQKDSVDEEAVRSKFGNHFEVVRDIKEKERLRVEMDRTTTALKLYDKYIEEQLKNKRNRREDPKTARLSKRKLSMLPIGRQC